MLVELLVRDLGVIAELRLTFERGMTVLSGETGAGKTMVVEALALLAGGRPDSSRVRPGADVTEVEGRFVAHDVERVVRRVVPRTGRSRAYIDGHLAAVGELVQLVGGLLEVHGQHSAQTLLDRDAQRDALDRFVGVDLAPLLDSRRRVAALRSQRAALGGDPRARLRELELLRYQLDELDAADLDDPDEDTVLRDAEDLLADSLAHREAVGAAVELLIGESGASDRTRAAYAALSRSAPLASFAARLDGLAAELDDVARDLAARAESIEDDPQRRDGIRRRRGQLAELRRRYGDTLAAVIAERDSMRSRTRELEAAEESAAVIDAEIVAAVAAEVDAARRVGDARRSGARPLAAAVEERLESIGLKSCRVVVRCSDDPAAHDVEFLLATNEGMDLLPLARVASGGELSRTMLALHLALSSGPPTMVFDEVDAGIGGATATEIGAALSDLAGEHQVFVVTHLPQVAAFADAQIAVSKSDDGALTTSSVLTLGDSERVVELSRMMSGSPESASARRHARELLADAGRRRGR